MKDVWSRSVRTREAQRVLLGSFLLTAASAMFYIISPYLAFAATRLSLDSAQLGTLAATESLAIATAALLAPLWTFRVERRACIVVGVSICACGNVSAGFVPDFTAFLTLRFIVGLLGEGVLYATAFAVLTEASNVDRAFAIALTAAVIFGAATTAAAAWLTQQFPANGPLVALGVVALCVLPFVDWRGLPATTAPGDIGSKTGCAWSRVALLGLLAQAVWFVSPGAFWAFVEQAAVDKGISNTSIELALSLAEITGLLGCVAAAWFGDRFGRLGPILMATVGMAVTTMLYQAVAGIWLLAVLLAIYYALWNYSTVYQYSFVAGLDATGRAAVAMPAANVFGMSVGPYLAGHLMLAHGDEAITIVSVTFAALGLMLYGLCFRMGRMRPSRPIKVLESPR